MLDLVVFQQRIDRHHYPSGSQNSQEGDDELRRVGKIQGDAVAFFQTSRYQPATENTLERGELAIGQGLLFIKKRRTIFVACEYPIETIG